MTRLLFRLNRSRNINLGLFSSFRGKADGLTKRAFDFIVALFGLISLSPVFAFVAILIKCDSPGPIFYWGSRIGKNGRVFKMLKFRTMYETTRSYQGPRITCGEDDRITPLGKWLRDTKLNEFPQLWNVLIGDMSLVGPRPEDPSIARTWPTKIAREILSVRPGITSPASILYRDEESMLHAGDVMRKYLHELSPDKMRLDQLYVRYHSIWLDIDVILWTILLTALLLIPKIRAYSPSEQLLFVGPVFRLTQRYMNWFIWDFLVVLASIGVTGVAVRLFGPLNIGWLRSVEIALGFSALYTLTGILLKTNCINWTKATFWDSIRLWLAWLIVTVTMLSIHYCLGGTRLPIYGILLGSSIFSFSGIIFVRYWKKLASGFLSWLIAYRSSPSSTREHVMVVGSGRTAEHIAWLMAHPAYSKKFQIVGFIDDDLRSQGMTVYGSKVIGRFSDIPRLVRKQNVNLIILANFETMLQKYKEVWEFASLESVRVVVAPDIFGSLSGLGNPSNTVVIRDLNDFQCQHCLARYVDLKSTNANVSES